MKYIDYHIHTEYSPDSDISINNRVMEVKRKQLYQWGISDHVTVTPSGSEYNYFDNERYNDITAKLRSEHNNFRKGIEFGYNYKYEETARDFLNSNQYDYVIGSIHRLDEIAISSSKEHHLFFPGKTKEEAYNKYFEELKFCVESSLFDIIGHFDIIKKYATQYYKDITTNSFKDIIAEILRLMIKKNLVLEINCAGLYQPPREIYPSNFILDIYYDLGGRLFVYGSDAHNENEILRSYNIFIEILKRYNIKEIAVFDNRQLDTIKL